MSIGRTNPATGELLEDIAGHSESDVDHILKRADSAFQDWRETSFSVRSKPMRRAAVLLRVNARSYAELMTREMGKPLAQGISEAEKCAWVCDYYAEHAEQFLASERVDSDAKLSEVAYRPLGVVLAVMPWNFPFWQVLRFTAPALMAGNAAVLKHASNVPECALAIEDLFNQAGFPADLMRALLVGSDAIGKLIERDEIRAVTLTGSTPAGRAVAATAGEALKKTVLELGGSDPYVVLSDADPEKAAESCVKSRLINSGQSCIAAKRFIVHQNLRDEFTRHVVRRMKATKVGDPTDEDTDVGPMAREDLRDELHEQVTKSIAAGANCLLGGEVPDRPGAWYPPTVLTDVRANMPAFEEELFGPVASIISAADDEQAIELANDSRFGLGASVFTRDEERGYTLARDWLEAGCCFVNDFVRSDPRLPFGGIKQSGYGRELGPFGIREFVNIKTVYLGKPS